ncbi:MAG: hypothetical protein FWG61_02230 [Firmicutes bacterium]|nr:hypothetical protein [Bacillota bacterium]
MMRKKGLLFINFIIFFNLCIACAVPQENIPSPDIPLGVMTVIEQQITETPADNLAKPMPQPFPQKKADEEDFSSLNSSVLLTFDPHNPEGWRDESVYNMKDETGFDWINKEKRITTADSRIDKFSLGMKWSAAAMYFPSKSYRENEWSDGFYSTKILIFDTLVLEFTEGVYDDISLSLSSIYICGAPYTTPRGLAVNDSVEKLVELYGTPACVIDSVWHYYDDHGYDLFQAMVSDNVIEKIHINQIQ